MTSRTIQDVQVGLFVFGLLVGLFQLASFEGLGFGRGFEMVAIAKNIAAQGEFGNPFDPAVTGPTAVVPPLYPYYLAAIIWLLGAPNLILFVATVSNVIVNAFAATLMPRLSLICFGSFGPGLFAGLLWTLSIRLMPQWDASYTAAGLIGFCILAADAVRVEKIEMGRVAVSGVVGGLLTLMNPASILVLVPWVVFIAVSRRVPWRRAGVALACLLGLICACNVPWIVRNYGIWNDFALRTNFGMTLYSSNNDCAAPSLAASMDKRCYQTKHPVSSDAEIRLLKELGEVEYDRMRTRAAMEWITMHPAQHRELTARRVVEFWFPQVEFSKFRTYVVWGVTVLSLPGLVWMARRREGMWCYVLFVWMIYPLMYYNVVSADRYRYPVLWTSLLPAGYLLQEVLGPFRKH